VLCKKTKAYTCHLSTQWTGSNPVYSKANGSLDSFLKALQRRASLSHTWYGRPMLEFLSVSHSLISTYHHTHIKTKNWLGIKNELLTSSLDQMSASSVTFNISSQVYISLLSEICYQALVFIIFSFTYVMHIQNKWQNYYFIHSNSRWYRSVSIATGYKLNFLGSIPGSARFFSSP
jgi:hypothetical protein